MGNIIIVGHRANTIGRLKHYLNLGVDMVEVDVSISNNILVAKHGMSPIRPPTLGERILEKVSYAIQPGEPLIRKTPLKEILKIVSGRAGIWLDLKDKGIGAQVIKLLKAIAFKGDIIVSSAYHVDVRYVKEHEPKILTAISLSEQPLDIVHMTKVSKADIISINLAYIDSNLVKMLHNKGIKVAAWIVNSPEQVEEMLKLNVDYIITDRPEIVLEYVHRRRPSLASRIVKQVKNLIS